nr:hypothetical protein [Tanacetum cinerariifolium]
MIIGSLKKSKKQRFEDLKPREQDTRRTSGNTTRIDPFLLALILEAQTQEKPILMLQSVKIPLEFSPFYNMKDIQAFYAKELPIPPPVILPPSLVLSQSPIFDSQDIFPSEEISPKDTETSVSPSLLVGSSSPIRSTTSLLDYPFDESIFAELDNSLWITP